MMCLDLARGDGLFFFLLKRRYLRLGKDDAFLGSFLFKNSEALLACL